MPLQANQMSVRELLEMVFANKWLFLLCTVMGFVVSYYVAESKVKRYRSSAEVYLQNPMGNDPITKGIGRNEILGIDDTSSFAFRFQKVSGRVLEKERIEAMAKDLNLRDFDPSYHGISVTANRMAIAVTSIRPGENGATETKKIADYVAQSIIDEYDTVRDEHIEEAITFLRNLRDRYIQRLHDAEISLQDFNKLQKLALIEDEGETQKGLESIDSAQVGVKTMIEQYSQLLSRRMQNAIDLTSLQAQKMEVIRQINQEPKEIRQEATYVPSAVYRALEKNYAEASAQLVKLRESRSDIHPDVEDAIANADRLKAELDNFKEPVVDTEKRVVNPVVSKLNLDRSSLETDIIALESEQEELKTEIADLGERIRNSDETEQRLMERKDLENTYALEGSMYQDLTQRVAKAEMAAELTKTDRSVRLSWRKRGEIPTAPFGSNKNFILAMGTFIGVVIGFVLCFAREFTDTSFRNLDDASRFLDLPVLGVIPEVVGTPRRRRIRKQKRGL